MLFSFRTVLRSIREVEGTDKFFTLGFQDFPVRVQKSDQRYTDRMKYEVEYQDDFLIIKLSGIVGSNERLLSKKSLLSSLQPSYRKVIVDLRELRSGGAGYCIGVLNTIKKEVQFKGGKMKICSLSPAAARYFRENHMEEMFEISPSIDDAKRSFLEGKND